MKTRAYNTKLLGPIGVAPAITFGAKRRQELSGFKIFSEQSQLFNTLKRHHNLSYRFCYGFIVETEALLLPSSVDFGIK